MLAKIREIWTPRRRNRAVAEVRRQIADCGYALDHLTDRQVEQAVTSGRGGIENAPFLTAKKIYWTLRRLSPDGGRFPKRKIKQP